MTDLPRTEQLVRQETQELHGSPSLITRKTFVIVEA
jgi:hypothetical protein